jgi:hypothetical protein
MRIRLITALLLLTATVPAGAQLSIGINISSYPSFSAVPGYPVYYAPDVGGNYFFYDGLYWVYQDDNWYSSSWYNGPWDQVGPMYVPIEVLQVPVRYYRRPPQYFRGWLQDRPPRWNDHWGRNWSQRRPDWDRPRHDINLAPAPLPDYQRRYSGKDYPHAAQQQAIQQQNYRYHSQNPAAGRDYGKQPDDRHTGSAPSNARARPTREDNIERQSQPRPVTQSRPMPQPQPQPQQQQHDQRDQHAQQDQHPSANHPPENKPRNDQNGDAGKPRDKDDKRD